MTDHLASTRIQRLHQSFLDAADKYPRLHLLAVHYPPERNPPAGDDDWEWPLNPYHTAWRHILLFLTPGCHLLAQTGLWFDFRPGETLIERQQQMSEPEVTPRYDDSWTGGFVYSFPERRLGLWSKWRFAKRYRPGVQEFVRLGELAAAQHLPAGKGLHSDTPVDSSFIGGEKRWIAKLRELDLFETVFDHRFTVLRTRGNLFSTSAQAIEMLGTPNSPPAGELGELNEQISALVTLDQVAPLAGLSKRSLERYLKQGKLPAPDSPGGQGRAHKWMWHTIRPHLSEIARRELPQVFPGDRII